MKKTTKPTFPSYKTNDLVNYLNDSGTCTLSQTFMPTYSNEPIKISSHDLFPSTGIYATVDGEITDIINIKDSFRFLPQEEKLKIVSVLLEFCASETLKLTSQNK
jgi:hypothetical protein